MRQLRDKLTSLTHARTCSSGAANARLEPAAGISMLTHSKFPFESHPGLQGLPELPVDAAKIILRNSELAVPPVEEWVFLDTETTGLAGGSGTYVFLVGLGQIRPDGFEVEQYFLEDFSAEPRLLAALADRLAETPVVVTFNGKLFDLPLLETRYRMNRRRAPLTKAVHLDLLFPARTLWRLRTGSARLTELERTILGFEREGDVPGHEIPRRYFDYLRTYDFAPLRPVLRHNAWDIVSLASLTARLFRSVAQPETETEVLEVFGLSKLCEKAGETNRAQILYERALSMGLPAEIEGIARRNLAQLYKRERSYERATKHWRRLTALEEESLAAHEELAICYEHRLRDLTAAREVTGKALRLINHLLAAPVSSAHTRLSKFRARFLRRRGRLERRLNKAFGPRQYRSLRNRKRPVLGIQ